MEEVFRQFMGSLSHYLEGFVYASCCRLSSINNRCIILTCDLSQWGFCRCELFVSGSVKELFFAKKSFTCPGA